ncbi:MAG: glycosyltransferase [Candidatus Schekmanbacteria bacterium]|nr:MAG: glycosyltransferase [Candidatus Schekmanbacteria bacterium]
MTLSSKSIKKPLKVLHTIYSLEAGGAERVVYHYALYHNRENFIPIVCGIKKGGEFAKEIEKLGVKVYIANEGNSSPLEIVKRIRKIIKEENVSIVHSHGQVANTWTIPAVLNSSVKCFVKTEHNVHYPGFKARIHSLINRSFYFLNDKIFAVSDAVRNAHLSAAFAGRDRFVTVHNGIDYDPFESVEIDKENLLKELNIGKDCLIVGTIGSLTKQKRQDVFLRAMAKVCNEFDDVRGIIVGKGPLMEELQSLSKRLNIENKVVFCGLRRDIPQILKLIDIFVLSSDWEGFPISLLEAMASGCPSVATNVGGNREAIEEGVNGYLVPPDDYIALAEKICNLLRNRRIIMDIGTNAKKIFLEKFTAEKMVGKSEEIYLDILKEKNSAVAKKYN